MVRVKEWLVNSNPVSGNYPVWLGLLHPLFIHNATAMSRQIKDAAITYGL